MYGPNNDDPNFFLEVFRKVEQFNYSSILCAGEFNVVIGPLDYRGRDSNSNKNARDMLTIIMTEFNLCDI